MNLERGRAADRIVSQSPDGATVLVTAGEQALLLRGAAARQALQENAAAVREKGSPVFLSDTALRRPHTTWRCSEELLAAARPISDPDRAGVYLVAASRIAALFDALQSGELYRGFIPVIVYGSRVVVGPRLGFAGAPCAGCYRKRLLAASPALAEHLRCGHLLEPAVDVETALAVGQALFEGSGTAGGEDGAIVVDLGRAEVSSQRLIPMPWCGCRARRPPKDLDTIVGDALGIAHQVVSFADGGAFHLVGAYTFPEEGVPCTAAGCSLSAARSRRRALAELIERRASAFAADRSRLACCCDLEDALPLPECLPYSDTQYAERDFQYTRLDAQTQARWLKGLRLDTGQRVWLPGAFVSIDPRFAQPALGAQASTGTAAAPTWQGAVEAAVAELAERDVAARCLFHGRLRRLAPADLAADSTRAAGALGLCVELVRAETDLPLYVTIARVHHAVRGAWALGFAASLDCREASEHAIEEAVQMWVRREQLNEPLYIPPGDWSLLPSSAADGEAVTMQKAWAALAAHYRPVIVDLTNEECRAVGLHVAAAWSAAAVDFPRAGKPLPLRRWGALAKAVHDSLKQAPELCR